MTVSDEDAASMADWVEHELDEKDIVEERPGPGRPPLPPGEAVDAVLTIRVTADEKRRFAEVAEQHGRTQSEEGRVAVRKYLGTT
jgi:hypothetical protein